MTRPAAVPERGYQGTVTDALDSFGWSWNHTFPLRTKYGWRTGTTEKGIPDLIAVRGAHLVAIEVKSDTGKPTTDQLEWLERFAGVEGGHGWVVAPDVPPIAELCEWLLRPAQAPRRFGFIA